MSAWKMASRCSGHEDVKRKKKTKAVVARVHLHGSRSRDRTRSTSYVIQFRWQDSRVDNKRSNLVGRPIIVKMCAIDSCTAEWQRSKTRKWQELALASNALRPSQIILNGPVIVFGNIRYDEKKNDADFFYFLSIEWISSFLIRNYDTGTIIISDFLIWLRNNGGCRKRLFGLRTRLRFLAQLRCVWNSSWFRFRIHLGRIDFRFRER